MIFLKQIAIEIVSALLLIYPIHVNAISDLFYIYGTSNRSLHSFTYNYLLNLINNQ